MRYLFRLDELPGNQMADGSVVRALPGEECGLTGSSLIWGELAPGLGPPLHKHPAEEVFLILRGRATFTIGDTCIDVEARNMVVAPAGVPHRFLSSGDEPLLVFAFLSSPRIVTEFVVAGDSPETL